MSCPCGSEQSLAECCEPYIRGDKDAPTPEALMRSRYTAYTLGNSDYIVETHHPDSRDEVDADAAKTWAENSDWLGLEIVSAEDGIHGDDTPDAGTVEFIAKYKANGKPVTHHEHSHFRRIDGKWYYETGHMVNRAPIVRDAPKVGRNEPCPCGSGKKFKKCHGRG